MLRNYHSVYSYFHNNKELSNQTAFHEAGHAASIYLGNKSKKLPPVFFQIQISQNNIPDQQYSAKVVDGHLIQNLPIVGLDSHYSLSNEDKINYKLAYEADVINLLVGPLAEAKYVSIKDDEPFNFNLINTHSLNYYGGSSDVEKAYEYLEYFIDSESEREEKMLDLFFQAFKFIDNNENWKCILNLAHYILESEKEIITCEQAIEVFEQCLN